MKDSTRPYEGVTLKMLTFGGASYQPLLQAFAEEFSRETGASVEITAPPYPYGWWYLEPMAKADATSECPSFDLFCDDREWQFVLQPHLRPLNPLIEAFDYDMEGFLEPVYTYDEGVAGQPGVRYGLPVRIRGVYIFYRTDLIEQFPTTWPAYDSVLAEHTGDGTYGLGVEGSVYPYHPFGNAHELTKLFLARFASLGGALLTPDWEPLIAGELGIEALEMLIRQVEAFASPDVLSWDAQQAAQAFLQGRLAVIESVGTEILPYAQDPLRSDIVDKWSVGLYPGGGTSPYTLHNMSIFEHSQHPEAAFAFIAHCTRRDSALRLQLGSDDDSARRTVLTSPQALSADASLTGRVKVLDRAVPSVPGGLHVYEMIYALWEAVQLSVQGYVSPGYALNRAARKWRALLAQDPPGWTYASS